MVAASQVANTFVFFMVILCFLRLGLLCFCCSLRWAVWNRLFRSPLFWLIPPIGLFVMATSFVVVLVGVNVETITTLRPFAVSVLYLRWPRSHQYSSVSSGKQLKLGWFSLSHFEVYAPLPVQPSGDPGLVDVGLQ